MSAQRDLFDTQMQLEDQLIDQGSPMVMPKAYIRKGWDKGPANFRIQCADRTIKYAGTDTGSWFTLNAARAIVNHEQGERVIEHDGVNILWEVL